MGNLTMVAIMLIIGGAIIGALFLGLADDPAIQSAKPDASVLAEAQAVATAHHDEFAIDRVMEEVERILAESRGVSE